MSTLILIERVNNIYTTTQLGIKKPSRYEGKKALIAAAAFGQEKEKRVCERNKGLRNGVPSRGKRVTSACQARHEEEVYRKSVPVTPPLIRIRLFREDSSRIR